MALQKSIIVSGRLGNVIFYEWRGIPCSRTMPVEVKQTTATKQSAKIFGQAARLAKALRSGLLPVLPDEKNRDMIYRFDGALRLWLKSGREGNNLSFIQGFSLNKEAHLPHVLDLLQINWNIPGTVIVNIPDIDPSKLNNMPVRAKILHCNLVITDCNIDTQSINAVHTSGFDIPVDDTNFPSRQIHLPFEIKQGNLAVVGLGIKFSVLQKGSLKIKPDMKWMPASIIDAKLI